MKELAWIGAPSSLDLLPVAGVVLLLAWPGGTAAQELETPFSGLDAPTPRIPLVPVETRGLGEDAEFIAIRTGRAL